MSDSENCLICQAPAHGVHFQVNSCRACAAFFRRSALIADSYKCRRATKNCVMLKDSKNNCRYCRYQKCLEVGMKNNQVERDTSSKRIQSEEPSTSTPSSSTPSNEAPSAEKPPPKFIFDKNKMVYDVKPLIGQLTELMNGAPTPVPDTIGIRPTAMQRLQYAFRAFHGGSKETVKDVDKLDMTKTMDAFEEMVLKIARWAMVCEEFVGLEWKDKWLVFKHLWSLFYTIERVYKTIDVLGYDTSDSRLVIDDQSAVNLETLTYDIPDVTETTKNNIVNLFKPHTDMFMKNLIVPMKQLRMTEYEVVYLLAQIMWSVKSCPGVSEQAGQIGEKYLDQISNEMHNYYVYELRLENYAARLTKLMKIQSEVEKQALYKKDLITVASVFDIFSYMSDDPEAQHLLGPPGDQKEPDKGWSCMTHYDATESRERHDEYAYQKTVQVGHFCDHDEPEPSPEEMRLWWRKNGIQPLGVGDLTNTFKNKQHKSSSTLNIVAALEDGRSPSPPTEQKECSSKRRKSVAAQGRFSPGRIQKVIRFVVEDWLCLGFLGIIMAVCSMLMDAAIENLQNFHLQLYDLAKAHDDPTVNIVLTYLVWLIYAVVLTSFSAIFVHYVAPQAIGSGIPEMKTILRGVILKEYLTFRTLVSKMIGLTLSLGSGLPIGKEGPFVHVASVVANLLSGLIQNAHGVYSNESRSTEMLAAGCAVGVACTFSAPVGGVLFSIEVTSVYFAVRNYWRGFFAAACSATLFRLLKVWLNETEVTVVAFYQTNFPREAFFPEELPVFALIGMVCGVAGALFVLLHRSMVTFLRRNGCAKRIFQKYWIVYPLCVSILVASLTYPQGYGQFLAGDRKFSQTLKDFFANCTWLTARKNGTNACPEHFVATWQGYLDFDNSIFVVLACFQITYFFLAALSSTLPIPAGIFMPVFVIGAAFGRMIGELMVMWFPDGIRGPEELQIFPGVYAVVGAAAFCGAVTHTVSVAVIVFELTGQLLYILPVMIAVLIANAICSYLQPSIYDSIIKIKHLPFLPHIPHTSSIFHGICAKQIMVSKVKYLSRESTYKEVQELLKSMPRVKAFPVVEDNQSMILLGSVSRCSLAEAIERRTGPEARQQEAVHRIKETIEDAERRFKTGPIERRMSILDSPFVANQGPTITVDPPSATHSRKPSTVNRFTVTKVPEELEKQPDLFKLSPSIPQAELKRSSSDNSLGYDTLYHTIGGVFRTLQQRLSFGRIRKSNSGDDYDLHGDEKEAWEAMRLSGRIDLEEVGLDAAPFQLVPRSSLVKVHSLFSLLGLNRAYVTQCGRLVGVVALRELRIAIERAQSGLLSADGFPMYDSDEGSVSSSDVEALGRKEDEESHDEEGDLFHLGPRLEIISRVSSAQTVPGLERQTSEYPASELQKKTEREERERKERRERRRTMSTSSDPCLIVKLEELKSQRNSVELQKPGCSSFDSVRITISDDDEEGCAPKGDVADISEEDDVFEPPESQSSTESKKKKTNHVRILIPGTPHRGAEFNYEEGDC
ncbi:hypothetical protein QR680_006040 [Steinernema hermaphroditum]|uniref:Chloride channel protein n=1 Tax=Steinernema hermaphroditum TaxID=289476 RepID=A0AA39HWA6_9BILA|nr:hypothetical protein QR680_006040 [Steinernema hermaphroditum]